MATSDKPTKKNHSSSKHIISNGEIFAQIQSCFEACKKRTSKKIKKIKIHRQNWIFFFSIISLSLYPRVYAFVATREARSLKARALFTRIRSPRQKNAVASRVTRAMHARIRAKLPRALTATATIMSRGRENGSLFVESIVRERKKKEKKKGKREREREKRMEELIWGLILIFNQ